MLLLHSVLFYKKRFYMKQYSNFEQFYEEKGRNCVCSLKFKKRINKIWVQKKSYRFLSIHTECNIWDRQNKEQEQECAPMLLLYSSMTPLQYALKNCTHGISGYWFCSRSLRFWPGNYILIITHKFFFHFNKVAARQYVSNNVKHHKMCSTGSLGLGVI